MVAKKDTKIVAFLLGFFFFVLGIIVGLIWDKKGKDYWKYFAIGAIINIFLIVGFVFWWSSLFWWAYFP